MKKNDPFNTLSKAKDEIARLQNEVAQTPAKHGSIPAVSKPPVKRTPGDLDLPVTTEGDLEVAIRAETDYKVRWQLMRSLASLQNARAVQEVKARKPIGVMATRSHDASK